jgi:hypothetical protein
MSEDTGKSPDEQPIANSEIKVFYYIDDQDPPYLTKLNVTGLPRLKDFKNALDRNCSKYKFFFATNDPSIGKVKEEITNDEQILPFDSQDRILAYLVSIEGSTTSSGGGGGGSKQSKNHHREDTILTSTTNSSFTIQQPRLQRMSRRYASANSADYQKYFTKPRAVNDIASFPSSDLESTTFLDETEDDRCVYIYASNYRKIDSPILCLDIQRLLIQQQFHHDIMVEIDLVEENIDYHPDLIE